MESNNILTTIDDVGVKKVLVCAKTTKQLVTVFQTDFETNLQNVVTPISTSLLRLVSLTVRKSVERYSSRH